MRLLQGVNCLSMPAEELLATCLVLRTDLEATTKNDVPSNATTQHTLQVYLQAQDIILSQVGSDKECTSKEGPLRSAHKSTQTWW
jgi:hypothetical protein